MAKKAQETFVRSRPAPPPRTFEDRYGDLPLVAEWPEGAWGYCWYCFEIASTKPGDPMGSYFECPKCKHPSPWQGTHRDVPWNRAPTADELRAELERRLKKD